MPSEFDKWYKQTWGSESEDTDESNKSFTAWNAARRKCMLIVHKHVHKLPEAVQKAMLEELDTV